MPSAAVVDHDGELVEIDLVQRHSVDSTGLRALLEARLLHLGLEQVGLARVAGGAQLVHRIADRHVDVTEHLVDVEQPAARPFQPLDRLR